MGKYELPKCDCGCDLKFVKEIVYHHDYKINKNGTLSKKKIVTEWADYGTEWLKCTNFNCNKCYWIEYDDNDRVIRGEDYGL
jgi:hypothetical protein